MSPLFSILDFGIDTSVLFFKSTKFDLTDGAKMS